MSNASQISAMAAVEDQPSPAFRAGEHPVWGLAVCSESGDRSPTSPNDLIIGWGLLQMYGQQHTHAGESILAMPSKTLPERLAAILLDGQVQQNGVVQDVSFGELAVSLGTSRETVASILRAFRRQGLIEVGYRRIVIRDAEMLDEIGGGPETCFGL